MFITLSLYIAVFKAVIHEVKNRLIAHYQMQQS